MTMTEEEKSHNALMKPQMTMKDVVAVLKQKTGRGSEGTVKMLWATGQLAYKVRRPANADKRFDRYSQPARGTRYSTPSDVYAYLKRINMC